MVWEEAQKKKGSEKNESPGRKTNNLLLSKTQIV